VVEEIDERFVTVGLGPTLDEATSCARNDTMDLIHRRTGRSLSQVIMVISAVGDRLFSYTFLPNLCRCAGSDMARIQAGRLRKTTSVLRNSFSSIQMDLTHRRSRRSLSEVSMVIGAVGDRLFSYTFLPNLCRCAGSDMARIQAGRLRKTTSVLRNSFSSIQLKFFHAKQIHWHIYCFCSMEGNDAGQAGILDGGVGSE